MRIPKIPTPPSAKPVKSGPKAPPPMKAPDTGNKSTPVLGSRYFGLEMTPDKKGK